MLFTVLIAMHSFVTDPTQFWRCVATALFCLGLCGSSSATAQEEEPDESLHFAGDATLGARFYVISPPFDNNNISGFFDQWRLIRGQGETAPHFVDLFHVDLGVQRADETWLARLERWSFNSLNEHGLFDVAWKGLTLEGDWRRYRGDWLRVFPQGTGEGNAFGSKYTPDIPNSDIFAENGRFWIRRQRVGGTVSLRPEDFEWDAGPLAQLSVHGSYEGRKGFRQDGVLLGNVVPTPAPDDRFRGIRRKVDQKISTVGGAAVFDPFGWFSGSLDVEFQSFREDAPMVEEGSFLPPGTTVLDFVPDTDRVTGRANLSKRWGQASLQGGGFFTHLEQTGRQTPSQKFYDLEDNSVTTYSLWTSFDWPFAAMFDVTGFLKWMHRHNGVDSAAFVPGEVTPLGQISPYIRDLGELNGNMEFGFQPMRGSRLALGYRVDYAHRDLRFPGKNAPVAILPDVSLVRPDSLHHSFYLSARLRARSWLEFQAELGFDWNPETAYPREFERAIYFEGRGSYTFPIQIPLTLAVSGQVIDGDSPGYELRSLNTRRKHWDRTLWNYDVTLSAMPLSKLALFASFTQHQDNQRFDYIRSTLPRYLPTDFYLDSVPDYQSDILSLTVGGSRTFYKSLLISLAASLTWTRAEYGGQSNTANVLEQADGLRNRIVSLEADVGYEIRDGVSVGLGYRWQNYDEMKGVQFLNYSETIHTISIRASVDFEALLPR